MSVSVEEPAIYPQAPHYEYEVDDSGPPSDVNSTQGDTYDDRKISNQPGKTFEQILAEEMEKERLKTGAPPEDNFTVENKLSDIIRRENLSHAI